MVLEAQRRIGFVNSPASSENTKDNFVSRKGEKINDDSSTSARNSQDNSGNRGNVVNIDCDKKSSKHTKDIVASRISETVLNNSSSSAEKAKRIVTNRNGENILDLSDDNSLSSAKNAKHNLIKKYSRNAVDISCDDKPPSSSNIVISGNSINVVDIGCDNNSASSENVIRIVSNSEDVIENTGEDRPEYCESPVNPVEKKYKKPMRPCVFCKAFQTKLHRHILRQHRNEPSVIAIMSLSKIEQDKQLDLLRKDGMFAINKELLKEESVHEGDSAIPTLLRERKQGKEDLKMCTSCHGFFAKSQIWKHLVKCSEDGSAPQAAVSVSQMKSSGHCNSNDFESILQKFRGDNIGHLCRTDSTIKIVGKILWERSTKKERKPVMGEMRKLGILLSKFRLICKNDQASAGDMLCSSNFRHVVEALNDVSDNDNNDSMKAGLKISLGYLLKKAARYTKSELIIDGNDAEVRQRDNFLSLLDSSWGHLFHSAVVHLEARRETTLRRPKNLPLEDDVKKLRDYTIEKLQQLVSDEYMSWTTQEFVALRSLLVCRLTLYNGRRGGEPARLLLNEWSDAETDVWVSPEMVEKVDDVVEKELLNTYKLAYQRGKGSRKMVPILIPMDSLAGIKKLVEIRSQCNIHENNPYLFATTSSIDGHALGWQCVNSTCIKANISNVRQLTATAMRHRASTYYALLDIPDQQRKAFYNHMGHSSMINETVYQCPPSILEKCKVGRYLRDLDEGDITTTRSKRASPSTLDPVTVISQGSKQLAPAILPDRSDSLFAAERIECQQFHDIRSITNRKKERRSRIITHHDSSSSDEAELESDTDSNQNTSSSEVAPILPSGNRKRKSTLSSSKASSSQNLDLSSEKGL
jgi:hypothetical protein